MKKLAISVIIPTYNRYNQVCEAVASVREQTCAPMEIIVVDDGSTDETSDLFARGNPDIQYIRQANSGPAAARNNGVRAARGEWIALLDSDDLWRPEKLAIQVQALASTGGYDICYTGEEWIRNGKTVKQKKNHAKYSGWIYEHCVRQCIVGCSTVMLRRAVWLEEEGMDETLPAAEDYDLWLRLSCRYAFLLVEEALVIKRDGHTGQVSHQWGLDQYRVKALQKMLKRKELSERQKVLTRVGLADKCRILHAGYLKHGKITEAEYYETLKDALS